MIGIAHAHGVPVLVDGAQSIPHFAVDMQSLDADFFASADIRFTAPRAWACFMAKRRGSTGCRLIWRRRDDPARHSRAYHLNGLPFSSRPARPTTWGHHGAGARPRLRFRLGHGQHPCARAGTDHWSACAGFLACAYWAKPGADAVISFLVGGIHHLDMGTLLDRLGIAVRTGHHCAEPLMRRLGVEGTVRAPSRSLQHPGSEV